MSVCFTYRMIQYKNKFQIDFDFYLFNLLSNIFLPNRYHATKIGLIIFI